MGYLNELMWLMYFNGSFKTLHKKSLLIKNIYFHQKNDESICNHQIQVEKIISLINYIGINIIIKYARMSAKNNAKKIPNNPNQPFNELINIAMSIPSLTQKLSDQAKKSISIYKPFILNDKFNTKTTIFKIILKSPLNSL